MTDRAVAWWLRAALAVPFVVALITLSTTHWTPVLDLAMTEFRVRDVMGRHTPLIGLPGRIGNFPDQGSHPGPLSFYLLAPVYRLFGSSAFGLEVGAAVVNVAAAWAAIFVTQRRGGRRLLLGVGATLMVALAWFGASILTQPWNAYLPLVSFIVALLAAWAVLDGDHLMLIPLVVSSSLCAQTHVPYLSLCVALCGLAIGVVCWRWWRARSVDASERRSVLIAVGLVLLFWLPVLADEIRRTPGNITMLRRHFLTPPESPIGLGQGLKTVLSHFDVTRIATGSFNRSGYFIDGLADLAGGSWLVGAFALAAWAVSAVVSLLLQDRRIRRLHLVVAIATMVAFLSTSRIFGKVWYYLLLWSWSIALVAVAATLWTAIAWWEQSGRRRVPLTPAALLVLALALAVFVKDAAAVDPPEDRLSRVLNDVVGPTADALRDGEGAADGVDGTYVVVWNDAVFFGSQGYGLISELERRGFDARVYDTYRVPVTPQRVAVRGSATAEIILTSGIYIEQWRAKPEAVQVAFSDLRTADELAEFQQLRRESIAALESAGLAEAATLVDSNLFGVSLDPQLPPDVERKIVRMLVIGEAVAIFIAPAGTF